MTQPNSRSAPAPVPCIRLTTETLQVAGPSGYWDEVVAPVIALSFDYGPGASGRRDPRAEAAARAALEGHGALELDGLEDCAAEPGSHADYVIRLDGDIAGTCAFSAQALPALRALGFRIDVDPAYPWQVVEGDGAWYARLSPEPSSPDAGTDWFGLELGVEIDGERVNLLPALLDLVEQASSLDALARAPKRIAIPVGERRYLTIPPERLRRLVAVLIELYQRDGRRDRVVFPSARAAALARLGLAFHDDRDKPLRWEGATQVRDLGYDLAMGPRLVPAPVQLRGLQASLRPYQQTGLDWMQHLRAHDAGGVMADDMGLGKTLQTIAHLLAEQESGRADMPSLVVVPTSLLGNWRRELARFAPDLSVVTLHGPGRHANQARARAAAVVLTTYPLLVRDREQLAAQQWHLLVLDEAHSIKNAGSQAHEAACALTARHRLCLTGTPVENHLGELWALFAFLMPGLLGTAEQFRTGFRGPIEQLGDEARLAVLRERVKPYILRRTKEQVARDLPRKTEIVRAVELGGDQRDLYESIRVAAHAQVRTAIRARGFAGSTIAVLDALLKLRQVCCDPRLATVVAGREVTGSAKLEALLELIERQRATGHRMLVFSQFTRMLGLIGDELRARGIAYLSLTGGTAADDRQRLVDRFESGETDVFLISLKAGGCGLNLVSADTVIHYDPWWNPAAQAQATDRVHRIGQVRPVFVYRLIVAGSVEERMLGLQEHKRRLADAVLAEPCAAGARLGEREVESLLAPLDGEPT